MPREVIAIRSTNTFLVDPLEGVKLRHAFLDGVPETVSDVVVDVSSFEYMTIAAARVLIADWLSAARARHPLTLTIATPNVDVIESIKAALGPEHAFWKTSPDSLEPAKVLGELTGTQADTLEFLRKTGPLDASAYRAASGMKPSAASNRLIDLANHGLAVRLETPGRSGDLFDAPWRAIALKGNGHRGNGLPALANGQPQKNGTVNGRPSQPASQSPRRKRAAPAGR